MESHRLELLRDGGNPVDLRPTGRIRDDCVDAIGYRKFLGPFCNLRRRHFETLVLFSRLATINSRYRIILPSRYTAHHPRENGFAYPQSKAANFFHTSTIMLKATLVPPFGKHLADEHVSVSLEAPPVVRIVRVQNHVILQPRGDEASGHAGLLISEI